MKPSITSFALRSLVAMALALSTVAYAATVVEYYNKPLDAYFITGRVNEQALLDTIADYQRTGMTFQAESITSATVGLSKICRFYVSLTTPFTSSHFYGREGAECEGVRQQNTGGFFWEDYDFAVRLATDGRCAAGTTPITRGFRAAAGGKTPNFRFTASAATYDAAIAAGYGPEGAVFCVSSATPATTSTGGSASFTSAVGAATGAPVSQSIDTAGGKISASGTTVRVPKNEFGSSANVTVQTITDTLNGSGTAIQISSSTPWTKSLVVSFPITAADGNPENINLALQNDDGSWTVLGSVADAATGTVTALIPPSSPFSASGVGSDHTKVSSSTGIRVGKLRNLIFTPSSATVKPGASVAFRAYARVDIENYDPQQKSPACTSYREAVRVAEAAAAAGGVDVPYPLASSACNGPVIRDLPFTNDKPGFTREWSLDGPGTLVAGASSGATYIAPGVKPSPNVARVNFTSKNLATTASVLMWAPVTITDVVKTYRGTYSASQEGVAMNGEVTWTLQGDGAGENEGYLLYKATAGTAIITTYFPPCSAPGSVGIEIATMRVKPATAGSALTDVRYDAGLVSNTGSSVCPRTPPNPPDTIPGKYGWQTCSLGGAVSPSDRRLQGSCLAAGAATETWDFIAVD
jgi:hypothetical protein